MRIMHERGAVLPAPAFGLRGLLALTLMVVATASVRAQTSSQPSDAQRAETPLAAIAVPAAETPRSEPDVGQRPDVQKHYEAARELIDDEQYEKAVIELDAALDAGGTTYDVLYLLAQAKQRLGRLGEARLAAEQAAAYRPTDADVAYLRGQLCQQGGRMEDAIVPFRIATLAGEREPENPRVAAAWFELGQSLAAVGYLRAATEAYAAFDELLWSDTPTARAVRGAEVVRAILAQHPHGAIGLRLALLAQLNKPEEALQAVREAVERRPNDAYLSRLYARTLLAQGKQGEAFEFCVQRLGPATGTTSAPVEGTGTALLDLAVEAARGAGRIDAWVTQLEGTLAVQGETSPTEAAVELGTRVAEQLDVAGEHAAAAQVWAAICAARPASADAAWAHALALERADQLEAALQVLIGFVRANPTNADVPAARWTAWSETFKDTDGFLRLVKEWTAPADCDFATHVVLGSIAGAAGQTELAERLLTTAQEQQPNSPLVHVAWGQMLLAKYHWSDAEEHAREALKLDPNLAAAQFIMAVAAAGLDEHDAAETAFKAALKAQPDNVTYLRAFAAYCRRTGNALAAQRYYQQVWTLAPGDSDAVEELVDCYLEGGKVAIARDLVQQAESTDLPADALRRIQTALRFVDRPLLDEHLTELARQFDESPTDVRTGLKLGAGLFLHERMREAFAVLQRVLAADPENESALNLMARVQMRRLETEGAIKLLERLERRYPRRAALLQLLSDAYLAEFRLAECRDALRKLLALDLTESQQESTRAQLLGTYVDFSEYDAALALARDWEHDDPNNPAWVRAELRVLLAAGRGKEAVVRAAERLEPVTQRFEEKASHFKELAAQASSNPDDADVQAKLQAAEQEVGQTLRELQERRTEFVQVCLQAEDYAALETPLRKWLAEQPEQPQYQEWLIELLLAAGRGDEALQVLSEYRLQTPEDLMKVFGWRVQAYVLAGATERALSDLTSLLDEPFIRENRDARMQVWKQLVFLLVQKQDYERAVALCDQWAATAAPQDRVTRYGILVLKRVTLLAAGRDDDAERVTEELLSFDPHEPGLNNDLGYSWVDRGQHVEQALEMIKLAVAAEPLNAAFLDSLGWAYYKSGQFPAAQRYLERATRLQEGHDPLIFDHLGDATYRLGDIKAARGHWQAALDILSGRDVAERLARDTALMATLRTKLEALDGGQMPPIAPTAEEQKPQPSLNSAGLRPSGSFCVAEGVGR